MSVLFSSPVLAYNANQWSSIYNNTGWFDSTGVTSCSSNILSSFSGSGSTTNASQASIANAQIIIGIDKAFNLGQQGALVGLITGLDESGLLNLANTGIPISEINPNKQGDGSDYDSLGIFQQRIASGWSTLVSAAPPSIESSPTLSQQYDNNYPAAVSQIMTPAYAAAAFYQRLAGLSGWQTMSPWMAAQTIQRSATSNGSNYEAYMSTAQKLVNSYYASSQTLTIPSSLNAHPSSSTGSSSYESSFICGVSANGVVSGSIVQTAVGLAWPEAGHGLSPTPAYSAAMQKFNTYGYTETGGTGADCGVFVATVMHASGADVNYPSINTMAQANYVISHPNLYQIIYPATSTSQLQPGDILILNQGTTVQNGKIVVGSQGGGGGGHTFIYTGPQRNGNNEASASLDDWSAQMGQTYLTGDSRGSYLIARFIGTTGA